MALRERMGRRQAPRRGVIDSQSVKSAEKGAVMTTRWVTMPTADKFCRLARQCPSQSSYTHADLAGVGWSESPQAHPHPTPRQMTRSPKSEVRRFSLYPSILLGSDSG